MAFHVLVTMVVELGRRFPIKLFMTQDTSGNKGPVEIIFSVVKQKPLQDILEIIKKHKPNTFYSIENVRAVSDFNPRKVNWVSNMKLLRPFF